MNEDQDKQPLVIVKIQAPGIIHTQTLSQEDWENDLTILNSVLAKVFKNAPKSE